MVIGFAACGGGNDRTIDITYDVCAGVTVSAPSVTDDQRARIDEGIELWRARGLAQLARGSGSQAIEIRFDTASPAIHGLYDDETGIVYVNAALADDAVAIVVAHELGHAFGLVHSTERASVMNPGNLTTAPTADDQAAIEARWGICD